MIIYLDITFFNNLLMTLAIIWTVGHLLEYKTNWPKLISAALVGTLYTFIIIYLQQTSLLSALKYIFHLFLNLAVAVIMIRIAYGKMKKRRFWKGVLYLYLISFLTIGTILSIYYIYGGIPFASNRGLFIIFGLLILGLLANYGWRLVQHYITPEQFFLPVEIILNHQVLKLTGLVDTGNHLTDPLTRVPVLVLYIKEILPILPRELQEKLSTYQGDELSLINLFNQFGLGNRMRILPFSGLGQEHGLLVGLRPDKIRVFYHHKLIESDKIVIGLSKQKLDQGDEYQMLIHPQVIKLQM